MATLRNGDSIVYSLFNGKMTRTGKARLPENRNFVIVCDYGDWSGFRTLAQCEEQFPNLEAKGKPNFYYQVVER